MDINGNITRNIFDQNLNTTDDVDFARVDVTDAITDNQQLVTKLYVDTHGGGGGGNMNYTGTTPATNKIYKASASNGQDAIESSITDNGTLVSISATNGLISNKLAINAGTNQQYLMADGSLLEASAQNGNANFYLYNNVNGLSVPPPASGQVTYNASTLAATTFVYISHLTRANIDIDVYFALINTLDDLYIQDQSNSVNFAKFNITGAPILNPNNYITIPVTQVQFGGNGNTAFGVNHDILVSFFSNLQEVNSRLTTLETKTQNQSAILQTTSMAGQVHILGAIAPYDQTLILNANSTLINSISSYSYNLAQSCQLQIDALATEIIGPVTCNNGLITTALQCTGQANVGISENPNDIFNNGSSLTKNNFNTSQSVGCIGFKDNWNTATGNNGSIKQRMIYMENVGRVIVVSNLAPQYFNDATGALITITGGLTGDCSMSYIPELGIAYSKNATQYSTSSNGITWTAPANLLGDIQSFGTVIYSASLGLYVADNGVGTSQIQTSPDGITWTNRTTSTRNIYILIYTGEKFITFGSGGCTYSYDGVTWFDDTVQLNNIRAAIYCESLGCILAQIQGGNRNIIMSYNGGLTWTTLTNVFPFATASNILVWDNGSGKAYNMTDDALIPINSYLFEFDASGSPALGGSIQMMGSTSTPASSGLTSYIYNPSIKRFLFTRNTPTYPVFYSTTSNNLAVSGNQYIIGSLNCSGGYNPYGLANIDIMLRDSPFIGIQFINGNASLTALSNSLWTAAGFTSNNFPTYALTNNFTRQLCCGNWTTTGLADGQACGYLSTVTTGAQVSRAFNFGLSAILGISDSAYNVNNCQNFFGLWNLATAIPLAQAAANQLSVLRNMICFGSDTNDPNICIYTAGAASTIKQVDLGASFPANRPTTALGASTDFFKFTLYLDISNNTSKFYYKAVNTTTNVIVSGTFTALAADIPATNTNLYPQCIRVQGTPQSNGQGRLQVQRFGVYY